MKVILTRSKPLSGRISALLSAICHAFVGGLRQNKKGHDASRHNSARGEKYIKKKVWKRREKTKEREGEGKTRRGVLDVFCLWQTETLSEKGSKRKWEKDERKRSGRNA